MLMYAPPWTLVSQFLDRRRPVFDPLSKVLVAITDPQQRVFSFRSFRLVREKARFFCTGAPVLGIIQEKFAWRLVDAGGSDSSTAGSKANSVSKLATRTSDAR